MTECFCGCGREIKRRHWLCHSANVAGRDATDALARLDEAQAVIEEQDPFRGDPAMMVDRFIAPKREMGQHYSRQLQNVAHGEAPPFGLWSNVLGTTARSGTGAPATGCCSARRSTPSWPTAEAVR